MIHKDVFFYYDDGDDDSGLFFSRDSMKALTASECFLSTCFLA